MVAPDMETIARNLIYLDQVWSHGALVYKDSHELAMITLDMLEEAGIDPQGIFLARQWLNDPDPIYRGHNPWTYMLWQNECLAEVGHRILDKC